MSLMKQIKRCIFGSSLPSKTIKRGSCVWHCILHLGWGSWCISPHHSWGARWGAGSTCFLLASGRRFSLCARAVRREPGINKRVALLALTLSVLYPNNDPHDSDPISQFLNLCLELIRSIHGHQTVWLNESLFPQLRHHCLVLWCKRAGWS